MDYVEYKITKNDEVVCKYVFEGRVIPLSNIEGKKLYNLLKKNNIRPQSVASNEESVIRCYGVRKYVNEILTLTRKKQRKKEVERRNLIKRQAIQIGSGALALTLFVTALGCCSKKNKTEKAEEKPASSISIEFDREIKDKTMINHHRYEIEYEEPTSTTTEVSTDEIVIEKEADYIFAFEYEDRSQSEKATTTKEMYYDVIKKYADMYGLPANLMVAVATQERGIHSQTVDRGGGFGLFQIQAVGSWNWINKEISAYNFETGQIETVTVCLESDGSINKNMLANLEYNTKIACMIMSANIKMYNYDIIAALQSYNSGTMVLGLKEKYGEDWVNHRENLPGDPLYIEHVLSYIDKEDNYLEYKDKYSNNYIIEINNLYNSKSHSFS